MKTKKLISEGEIEIPAVEIDYRCNLDISN